MKLHRFRGIFQEESTIKRVALVIYFVSFANIAIWSLCYFWNSFYTGEKNISNVFYVTMIFGAHTFSQCVLLYIGSRKSFNKSSRILKKNQIILLYLLPLDKQEDVEGLLADKFEKWAKKFGEKRATHLVAWHTFWIIVHHHWARLVKVFGGLAALMGIKKAWEWMAGRFF